MKCLLCIILSFTLCTLLAVGHNYVLYYCLYCICIYDFKQHYPSVVCYDSFKHSSLQFTPASNVNSIIHNKTLSYILCIINLFHVATKTKNLKLQMSQIFHKTNNIFEACCLIMLSVVMNITGIIHR